MAAALNYLITAKQMNGDILQVELVEPRVDSFKKAAALNMGIDANIIVLIDTEGDGNTLDDETELYPDIVYLLFVSPSLHLKMRLDKVIYHIGIPEDEYVNSEMKEMIRRYKKNSNDTKLLRLVERYEDAMDYYHNECKENIEKGYKIYPCPCMKDYILEQYKIYEDMYEQGDETESTIENLEKYRQYL